jgi:hypothetical protein
MKRRLAWFLAAGLVAAAASIPHASTARFWQISTQAELLKGDVERLSIDFQGRLVVGPSLRTVFDATAPFIWTLVASPDGSVYAGGGNDGQVWRVDRDGKSRVVFDAAELEVHALAVGRDGMLYAGTSPDGKVYRIDAQGKSSVFFDPEDKYIWALAFDAQGQLLVATGDKGLVYKVAPDGKGTVFCKTLATHAVALAFDRQGQLLVGTESPGRILRVNAAGRPFVLLDTPYREVRGLHVDRSGAIFAAAINGKAGGSDAPAAGQAVEAPKMTVTPSVSAEITTVTVVDAPPTAGSPAPAAPRPQPAAAAKGAVYRVAPDGTADAIWESRDDQPFDLLPEDTGSVLVSTGNSGKLYRLGGDPWRAMLVTRVPGQQATSLVAAAGGLYVSTSNPARIVRLDDAPAADGSYTSEAKDAGTVATWGTISWRAVAAAADRVQVFTRTGNTQTPDDTWSEWAGPYQAADGDAIKSPAARYLQWRAVLKRTAADTASPALVSLRVAYLQKNLRPRVTGITVHPAGVAFQRPYPTGEPEIAGLGDAAPEARLPMFSLPVGTPTSSTASGPALGRRMYQKGLQTFLWKAEDDNDDRLTFDVSYRAVTDTVWHALRRGMAEGLLTWDTTSVPDGTYVVKVAASDAGANTPGAGLAGELESDAFDVDNGAPLIAISQVVKDGAFTRIVFDVSDAQSAVASVEYSVDAGRWQSAFPTDGAADSRRERYEIRIEGEAAGRVVIRASDTMNNAATARVDGPATGSAKRAG